MQLKKSLLDAVNWNKKAILNYFSYSFSRYSIFWKSSISWNLLSKDISKALACKSCSPFWERKFTFSFICPSFFYKFSNSSKFSKIIEVKFPGSIGESILMKECSCIFLDSHSWHKSKSSHSKHLYLVPLRGVQLQMLQ